MESLEVNHLKTTTKNLSFEIKRKYLKLKVCIQYSNCRRSILVPDIKEGTTSVLFWSLSYHHNLNKGENI